MVNRYVPAVLIGGLAAVAPAGGGTLVLSATGSSGVILPLIGSVEDGEEWTEATIVTRPTPATSSSKSQRSAVRTYPAGFVSCGSPSPSSAR